MVRSSKGIELMLNLINISYSAMKILPYQYPEFSEYRNQSSRLLIYTRKVNSRRCIFMDFREKNRKDRKKQLIYSKYWIHYFPSRIINHKTCKVVFISIREYYFEYWLGFWTNCPKVMKKVFFQNGF